MAYLTILIAAALALATTLFALQNSTPVAVNLFLWTMESSLVVDLSRILCKLKLDMSGYSLAI